MHSLMELLTHDLRVTAHFYLIVKTTEQCIPNQRSYLLKKNISSAKTIQSDTFFIKSKRTTNLWLQDISTACIPNQI